MKNLYVDLWLVRIGFELTHFLEFVKAIFDKYIKQCVVINTSLTRLIKEKFVCYHRYK